MQELLGTIGRVRAINIITTIDITITTRMLSFASLKSKQQMAILRLLLRRAFVQHAWRRRRRGWSTTYIQVYHQNKKEFSVICCIKFEIWGGIIFLNSYILFNMYILLNIYMLPPGTSGLRILDRPCNTSSC